MRSATLKCESRPTDVLHFNGECDTAEFLACTFTGTKVSMYPSRNDLIRMRKAIGEYLKATRKAVR